MAKPCVQLASRPRDLVLDPFLGSGTTGLVALGLDRLKEQVLLRVAEAEAQLLPQAG